MAQKVEWVIKPGNVERKQLGKKQPGVDLTRVVFDTLKNSSLVVTSDCCSYYPTFPVLIVADRTSPTSTEMKDIPVGGIFIAKESTTDETWILWIKYSATTAFDFGDNS